MQRELLRGLSNLGRPGGLVALIGGLAGLAAAIAMIVFSAGDTRPGHRDPRAAGLLLVGSLVFIGVGAKILLTGGAAAMKPLPLQQLRAEVRTRPRPFTVCVRCQRFAVPHHEDCERCGEPLLKVSTDADVEAAAKRLSTTWS